MTTKLVCYGGHSKYMSDELNRTEAYTLSVVEHVLGSNQFFVEESKDNYTEELINKLKEENYLISENLFTRLVDDGFAVKSAVFSVDDLHKTINDCKKHTSQEWEVLDEKYKK